MRCRDCGHVGDAVTQTEGWAPVTDGRALRPLLECEACGSRQHLQ